MACRTNMFRLVTFFCLAVSLTELLFAQEAPDRRTFDLATTLQLAIDPAVIADLSLTDEQREEVSKLIDRRKKAYDEYARGFRDGTDALRTESERQASRKSLHDELQSIESSLAEVLVPSQIARFRQIVFQQRLRASPGSFALLHGEMINRLSITDDQQRKIAESARKHEEKLRSRLIEMRKEIERLQEQAQSDLMEHLTPSQREEYENLYGRPFVPNSLAKTRPN